MQKEVLASLQSLTLEKDLSATIRDSGSRERYQKLISGLGNEANAKQEWEDLQNTIAKEYAGQGAHWQFLALQEGYAKIYPPGASGASQ